MNAVVESFLGMIALLFISYMLLYTTYLLLSVMFGSVSLYEQDRKNKLNNELKHPYYVPVSIIVPAHNECVVIVDTITNLLHLKYKLYEIIIVDDGSTDGTSDELLANFPLKLSNRPIHRKLDCKQKEAMYEGIVNNVHMTLVKKANGGKSDALNMGINLSNYPYFVTCDADSLLQEDALEKIIQPVFEDEQTVAVGGMIRIGQCVKMIRGKVQSYHMPWQPIIGMQVVEYDRSFLASRILFDQFNGNLIISGAFGLFKKDIVIAIGGYRSDIIGEDMELVMRLHTFILNNNYAFKIRYQTEAVCWSQAPESVKDVIQQRRRWYLGLFQSLVRYPALFSRFKYKPVSFISYLFYIFFELLGPFIEIFGLLTIVLAYFYNLLNVTFMIELFVIYTGFGILISLTAFLQRVYTQGLKLYVLDIMKAITMVIIENVIYRYFLSIVRVTSFIQYKKNRKVWGDIKRHSRNDHSDLPM